MESKACKYDIEGLLSELEVDYESIVGLYSSYFEEMREETASLLELLSQKDWIRLERVVHNIKGVSANLFIDDVFSEAAAFNSLLKENNTNKAEYYVEKITDLISKAEIEIKEYFSQMGYSL